MVANTPKGPITEMSPPSDQTTDRDYTEETISAGTTPIAHLFLRCKFVRCKFEILPHNICFTDCEFRDCHWETVVSGAVFDNCRHIRSNFANTQLGDVKFLGGSLINTSFSHNTVFHNVSFSSLTGLHTSHRLDQVRIQSAGKSTYLLQLDAQIESTPIGWLNRRSSWTRLRGFGKLPFFGFSYTAIGGIITAMLLHSLYNDQIDHWKSSAEATGGTFALLASHLHRIEIPSQSLQALAFLVLLAIASTIYTRCCPSKVQEFSYDRWVHELQHPAINYIPLGWQCRTLRTICMFCYYVGAAGMLWVFSVKLCYLVAYISDHSQMPLWWR